MKRRSPQVVILAAGRGTRLGKTLPKPLTALYDGQTILHHQLNQLRRVFGADVDVTVVVGFKLELVIAAEPDVRFAYNERFDQTNTSKSLLKALRLSEPGGVLWMNGDVVFESEVLDLLDGYVERDRSLVCVNTATVGEEEVKYRVDERGRIAELSKQVTDPGGEAVGINYVSARDKPALISRLAECQPGDYFERGIELTIVHDRLPWTPVDVSGYGCLEVDFDTDLAAANAMLSDLAGDAL